MIFTGRNSSGTGSRDYLDCEHCGYQTSVAKCSRDIPSMKCPQKDCGKSSEDA
jgi:ribosomal protein S26